MTSNELTKLTDKVRRGTKLTADIAAFQSMVTNSNKRGARLTIDVLGSVYHIPDNHPGRCLVNKIFRDEIERLEKELGEL